MINLRPNRKAAIVVLATSVLLIPLGANANGDHEPPAHTWPGIFPITDEVVRLQVMGVLPAYLEDSETNDFTQWYRGKTNVVVDFEPLFPHNFDTAIDILFSSNADLPDIIMGPIGRDWEASYGESGRLVKLDEYIDRHGFYLKRTFETSPELRALSTTLSGVVYSVPISSGCLPCPISHPTWINGNFIRALGMNVPATVLEFEEYLRAVRERDPNGNGIADEIPFTGPAHSIETAIYGPLLQPFLGYEGKYNHYFSIVDGEVVPSFVQEGWRDGLKWVAHLYEDDLIDPQKFTEVQGAVEQTKKPGLSHYWCVFRADTAPRSVWRG